MSQLYFHFLHQFFHQDMHILESDVFSAEWAARFAWSFAEKPDQVVRIISEIDQVLATNPSDERLNEIWMRSVPSTYTFHGRSLMLILVMMRGAFASVKWAIDHPVQER